MIKNLSISNASACRWIARLIGAFVFLVTVYIAIGQGLPNIFAQPVRVQLGFVALALILIGILAGWRWELSGGIISLAGWCLFLLAVLHSPRALNGFIMAMAVPGALYVASALLRRHRERHT
jgi:hypothetical protein